MVPIRPVAYTRTAVATCVVASLLATAACSSSTATDSGNGASSDPSSSAIVAQAKAAVAKAEQANGSYTLPASGPTAQKGKNVFVVTCGAVEESCETPALNVQKAAAYLGWHVTIVDGKLTPAGFDAGIRQAIAAHADGILLFAVDCSNAKGALEAAKAAKIPVVGVHSFDCSDPHVGGPSLFTTTVNTNGGDPDQAALADGKLRADYAIAQTNGHAKVVALEESDFLLTKYFAEGFTQELKKCAGCSIVAPVQFTANDFLNGGDSQKLTSALLQHPSANVLFITADGLLQAVLPALRSANRSNLLVIANEGLAATQALIRSGVVSAAVGFYNPWTGWAGADAMNRVFAGQTKFPSEGEGYRILTKETLPQDGGVWSPPLDFQAAFKKIWAGQG